MENQITYLIYIIVLVLYFWLISATIFNSFRLNKMIELNYLLRVKFNKINYKKLIKWFFLGTIISYFCSINNTFMSKYDIIGFPLLFISFVVMMYFFGNPPMDAEIIKEYKESKIEIDRDFKINKILK